LRAGQDLEHGEIDNLNFDAKALLNKVSSKKNSKGIKLKITQPIT
jgi:hypothetical protein